MAQPIATPEQEPLFFRPGGKIFLILLSIVSLGYFFPVLMASLRRAAKTNTYFTTLILGIIFTNIFKLGNTGYVVFGIVVFLQSVFTQAIVPPAREHSVEFQLAQGVNMTTPFHIDAADGSGSGLQYFMKSKSTVEAIQQAQATRNIALNRFYRMMQEFDADFPTLDLGDDQKAEVTLFTCDDCTLVEPRKGPTVTERETSTGIRPFVGTKVGPFLVGGAGPQKSHSTSVTTRGDDVVQAVDTGHAVVTTRGISFVGDKYTRHSEFKTIIASEGDTDVLTISDSKRSTVWSIAFPDVAKLWVAASLVDAAAALSDRRLDLSGKATFEEIQHAIDKRREEIRQQIGEAYQQAYEEFEAANDQLREYHRVYPNQVSDPGPRTLQPNDAITQAIAPPSQP